ncbi:hypothetical protein TNCV_4730821 [Trichonephila clavipes]|nr:hypothetical protein TNCV_4730821 [Trichonephila clavipes]
MPFLFLDPGMRLPPQFLSSVFEEEAKKNVLRNLFVNFRADPLTSPLGEASFTHPIISDTRDYWFAILSAADLHTALSYLRPNSIGSLRK